MGNRTTLYSRVYDGTIEQRLALAHRFFTDLGAELLADAKVVDRLARVLERAGRLEEQMTAMVMGATCSRCAMEPGGGCCSSYMANENDAVQLLMNLLAGVVVEQVRHDGIECCFLAETGCILTLKPLFCLNYNCGRIKEAASASELALLEQRTGDLLRAQVDLEQHLLQILLEKKTF